VWHIQSTIINLRWQVLVDAAGDGKQGINFAWPYACWIKDRHSSPELKSQLFICSKDRVMIAGLIVWGRIWYFGKHKVLKPKRGAVFFSRVPHTF